METRQVTASRTMRSKRIPRLAVVHSDQGIEGLVRVIALNDAPMLGMVGSKDPGC